MLQHACCSARLRWGKEAGNVVLLRDSASWLIKAMIGAKRKAESGPIATKDLVQQALQEAEAKKQAKKLLKDPTGDLPVPVEPALCLRLMKC